MRRNPSERLDERQSRSHRATVAGEPRGSRRSSAISERRTRWHDTPAPWTPRAVAAEAAEARSAALPRDAFAAGKMCDVPKTLESTSAPASSETGTYRLHLGHRDPGSTLLIHAEPLQDTRAPRSARDARRALQCASPAFSPERGVSQQPLQLRFSVNGGAARQKRIIWFKNALSPLERVFDGQLERRRGQTRNSALRSRGRRQTCETNERARFVEGRQAGPRGAHEARAARTRPPVLFVSITGTFSGSSGERYVPSLMMRPIEPPIPVRRLPSLAPVCQRGN